MSMQIIAFAITTESFSSNSNIHEYSMLTFFISLLFIFVYLLYLLPLNKKKIFGSDEEWFFYQTCNINDQ